MKRLEAATTIFLNFAVTLFILSVISPFAYYTYQSYDHSEVVDGKLIIYVIKVTVPIFPYGVVLFFNVGCIISANVTLYLEGKRRSRDGKQPDVEKVIEEQEKAIVV